MMIVIAELEIAGYFAYCVSQNPIWLDFYVQAIDGRADQVREVSNFWTNQKSVLIIQWTRGLQKEAKLSSTAKPNKILRQWNLSIEVAGHLSITANVFLTTIDRLYYTCSLWRDQPLNKGHFYLPKIGCCSEFAWPDLNWWLRPHYCATSNLIREKWEVNLLHWRQGRVGTWEYRVDANHKKGHRHLAVLQF